MLVNAMIDKCNTHIGTGAVSNILSYMHLGLAAIDQDRKVPFLMQCEMQFFNIFHSQILLRRIAKIVHFV